MVLNKEELVKELASIGQQRVATIKQMDALNRDLEQMEGASRMVNYLLEKCHADELEQAKKRGPRVVKTKEEAVVVDGKE